MLYAMVVNGDPSLVYRGAVAFGEFFHDDRFVIGPAIDEAVEYENIPDAGIVWLAPSAHEIVREARFSPVEGDVSYADLEPYLVPDYAIPAKGSDSGGATEYRHGYAVSPFLHVLRDYEDGFMEAAEGSFSVNDASVSVERKREIERKRENTMTFLRLARRLDPKRLLGR
jgi:hypothetical protein